MTETQTLPSTWMTAGALARPLVLAMFDHDGLPVQPQRFLHRVPLRLALLWAPATFMLAWFISWKIALAYPWLLPAGLTSAVLILALLIWQSLIKGHKEILNLVSEGYRLLEQLEWVKKQNRS